MLEVKQIVKTFFKGTVNEKVALHGVDLRLESGDFATVIGGNGAGKSTLLNSIAGVFPIDSGSIHINDTDITKMPEYKRSGVYRPCIPGPYAWYGGGTCKLKKIFFSLCAVVNGWALNGRSYRKNGNCSVNVYPS